MKRITWVMGRTQVWRDQTLMRLLTPHLTPVGKAEFLMLVPTNRRARFFKERLQTVAQKNTGRRLWEPRVMLIKDLAEENAVLARRLQDLEKLVCVEEALLRIRPELQYFRDLLFYQGRSRLEDFPGILRKLAGFITRCKENRIYERFFPADEHGNSLPKNEDLRHLLDEYQRILDEFGLADGEDQLDQAVIEKPREKVLVLDGFYFMSRLEEEFVQNLLPHFDEVIVTTGLEAGDRAQMLEIFFEKLREGKEQEQRVIKPEDEIVAENAPRVLSLHNRVEEVRFICREIKRLAQSDPDFERVHVVFPKIDRYISIIYEIFPQYGIPFSITRGLQLNSSPIAIVMLAILQLPQEFSREEIFRFFSSRLVEFREPISRETFEAFLNKYAIGKHSSITDHAALMQRFDAYKTEQTRFNAHFDVATLDRFARSANIRGGDDLFNDWFLPLDQNYFAHRFRAAPEGEEKDRVHRDYFRVLRQLQFLDQVIADFSVLRRARTPEEVLAQLRDKVSTYKILGNVVGRIREIPGLSAKDQMFLLRRDISAFEEVFKILNELQEAFALRREIRAAPAEGDSALAFTARLLSQELAYRVIQDPIEANVVQITETLEVRGIDFDHCFFGGLCAEDYPREEPPDFILPDAAMAGFRQIDVMHESRYLFRHVLGNSQKSLTLTYPRVDRGRENSASVFLEDLRLPIEPAKIKEPGGVLYSHSELEEQLAGMVTPGSAVQPPEFLQLLGLARAPQELRQALEVELSRSSNQKFGAFDGILTGQKPWLSEQFKNRIFSYTQLDEFAACPQFYYYKRILKLEPLDELTEEMEADEFGSLVHLILENFHQKWLAQNRRKITPELFDAALLLMNECAEKVVAEQGKRLDFIFWERQIQKITTGLDPAFDPESAPMGILRAFLEHEREMSSQPFETIDVEEAFGFETPPLEVRGLKIRGKIDRIDQSTDEQKTLRILDYKTGKTPATARITRGLSFQMPVYLMAQRQNHPQKNLEGGYYSLKNAADIVTKTALASGNPGRNVPRFDGVFAALLEDWMVKIAAQMQHGEFHYAFEPVKCKFCDYRQICRRDPQRLWQLEKLAPDTGYNPEGNAALYAVLKNFAAVQKTIETKLRDKAEKTRKVLGSAEEHLADDLRAAYEAMPPAWQTRLQTPYQLVREEWQAFVDSVGRKKP